MANGTSIEWTDATWNPMTGCSKISPGCDHCYAERFSERFRGTLGHPFENGFDLTLRPEQQQGENFTRSHAPALWCQKFSAASLETETAGDYVDDVHPE